MEEIDFIIESLQINGFATIDSGYSFEFVKKLKLVSETYANQYNDKYGVEKLSKSGEINATLRRGDTLEALDLDRANELLAGRRAWEAEKIN